MNIEHEIMKKIPATYFRITEDDLDDGLGISNMNMDDLVAFLQYKLSSRDAEWVKVVEGIVPHHLEPSTKYARTQYEMGWNGCRMEAERLKAEAIQTMMKDGKK
jgi:hypothetical protein